MCQIPENPFLDKDAEILLHGHKLPHWDQTGKYQFVTFRLADSLPKYILKDYEAHKKAWLALHPKPWTIAEEKEFVEKFQSKFEEWTDAGYGESLLRNIELARFLEDCLFEDHESSCHIISYVVMPNHVHVLALIADTRSLEHYVRKWKSKSAIFCNKLLNRSGTLWQTGYYDRLIRNEQHLKHVINYIENNARKGGILWG